jgi:hypothetical protein
MPRDKTILRAPTGNTSPLPAVAAKTAGVLPLADATAY